MKEQLKESLKRVAAARKNHRKPKFNRTIPCDLPEGVKLTKTGEFVLPIGHAKRADLLYRTTQLRLEVQRRCTKLEELESKLEAYFIDELPMSNATGIAGQVARVQIKPNDIPQVENWDKFYAYVRKKNAFELLQRRITKEAANEIIDAGKAADAGLTVFKGKKVSCTKL